MESNHKKIIEDAFEHGILLNEKMLSCELKASLLDKLNCEEDLLVLNEDYANILEEQSSLVDWYDIDKYRVQAEQNRDDQELYQAQLQTVITPTLNVPAQTSHLEQQISTIETNQGLSTEFTSEDEDNLDADDNNSITSSIDQEMSLVALSSTPTILISFENKPKKYAVKDFAQFFISRYRFLEKILRNRRELQNTTSIHRLLGKKEREAVSVIGLVVEISETRNGNLILTIEDPTGLIKILISKNKPDLFVLGKDLVVDEVIGISGMLGENIIFADSITWPDVPSSNIMKKGPVEEYVIFLSDIHVGSKLFMKDEFNKFIKWLKGEVGNESQRSIANKVKYIIIAGDLVDGVGIYPNQQDELEIDDITEQYAEFSRLISQVPSDKHIIICPGNHDAVHLAEPQPAFFQEFSQDLFTIPNVQLVTNPSYVNIGKTEDFEGFTILLYHGYSFDYYVANVESIRMGGGYHRSDLIMKFLLKRRHMAPSFKSTPYYPSHTEDPLLITKIPDFFITGHIHYSSVANYKGITTISGSCWQAKTTFQEKLGHEPEPCRVPIVNLQTREIKVLRFG